MHLVVKQGATTVVDQNSNLTATSPGCTDAGMVQCVFKMVLPVGAYLASVTLYDQANEAGNVVGTTTTPVAFTVAPGSANNVHLSLGGFVDHVALPINSFSEVVPPYGGGLGSATPAMFDVDGNQIVNAGGTAWVDTSGNTFSYTISTNGTSPFSFTGISGSACGSTSATSVTSNGVACYATISYDGTPVAPPVGGDPPSGPLGSPPSGAWIALSVTDAGRTQAAYYFPKIYDFPLAYPSETDDCAGIATVSVNNSGITTHNVGTGTCLVDFYSIATVGGGIGGGESIVWNGGAAPTYSAFQAAPTSLAFAQGPSSPVQMMSIRPFNFATPYSAPVTLGIDVCVAQSVTLSLTNPTIPAGNWISNSTGTTNGIFSTPSYTQSGANNPTLSFPISAVADGYCEVNFSAPGIARQLHYLITVGG
jgi:hypothetical protein